MSGYCLINNNFDNSGTGYSFQPNGSSSLSSGDWVISPQPIGPNQGSFLAFQAQGVDGTATGAVGQAGYNVMAGTTQVGTLTLHFSDPYDGDNSASYSTNVNGLVVGASIPSSGRTITCTWTSANNLA
jgi:hypothetical protein